MRTNGAYIHLLGAIWVPMVATGDTGLPPVRCLSSSMGDMLVMILGAYSMAGLAMMPRRILIGWVSRIVSRVVSLLSGYVGARRDGNEVRYLITEKSFVCGDFNGMLSLRSYIPRVRL